MLVLSRKKGEAISIGQDIVIKVLRVKGNTIQLGIEAPRDIRIARGELNTEPQPKTDNFTLVFDNSVETPPLTTELCVPTESMAS